ncbi:unnamed protein product [Amoebophrya sp. A120]|nr:unnamed protein product [Amoebophrya sp. A120]|eukprot:GSA120T00009505001.1
MGFHFLPAYLAEAAQLFLAAELLFAPCLFTFVTATASPPTTRYVCFPGEEWMEKQCCNQNLYGPKGLSHLCFQHGGFSFDMCCTGRTPDGKAPAIGDDEEVMYVETDELEKRFPDGCSSHLSWIPMIYAVLLLTSVTYNQVGEVVRNEDREHFLSSASTSKPGVDAAQSKSLNGEAGTTSAEGAEEQGRIEDPNSHQTVEMTIPLSLSRPGGAVAEGNIKDEPKASTENLSEIQSTTTISRASNIEYLVLQRVGFSMSHFYRGAIQFFKHGKLDLGMISMLNDILRNFAYAFSKCPMVTSLAVLLKAHQLSSQDVSAALDMYSSIVTLVTEAEKAQKIPNTSSWGWGILVSRFNPVNTRVFQNRTRMETAGSSAIEWNAVNALRGRPDVVVAEAPPPSGTSWIDALLKMQLELGGNERADTTRRGEERERSYQGQGDRESGHTFNFLAYSPGFGFAESTDLKRLEKLKIEKNQGKNTKKQLQEPNKVRSASRTEQSSVTLSNPISSFTGYRTSTADFSKAIVSLPDGRFSQLTHVPTVDIVMPYCCEGFLDLNFAVGDKNFRVILYDICGCDASKLQELDGIKGNFLVVVQNDHAGSEGVFAADSAGGSFEKEAVHEPEAVARSRTTAALGENENEQTESSSGESPPATSTSRRAGLSKLYFDNSLTEAVPSGEIVAYFYHLWKYYDRMSDVTLFLHPDYQEHIREQLLERVLYSLKGNNTWDFSLGFMYLGWRHESPVIDGKVGPHWSRHCPHYVAGGSGSSGTGRARAPTTTKNKPVAEVLVDDPRPPGTPLYPCRFDEWAFSNVVRRHRHDVVGDYNPELLRRIWRILFQEEFHTVYDDFGGYDFNQFLVSRDRVRSTNQRSYYRHVAYQLQDLAQYRELFGGGPRRTSTSSRSSPTRNEILKNVMSRSRGHNRANGKNENMKAPSSSRQRLKFKTGRGPGPARHPNAQSFVSDRVDLTPRYGFNKGVCIWFEHLWHLLFGVDDARWKPKEERSLGVGVGSSAAASGLLAKVDVDLEHSGSSSSCPAEIHRDVETSRRVLVRPPAHYLHERDEIQRRLPHRDIVRYDDAELDYENYTPNYFHKNFDYDFTKTADVLKFEKRRYLSYSRWDDATLPLAFRDYVDSIQLHKYLLTPNETCALMNKCMPPIRLRI